MMPQWDILSRMANWVKKKVPQWTSNDSLQSRSNRTMATVLTGFERFWPTTKNQKTLQNQHANCKTTKYHYKTTKNLAIKPPPNHLKPNSQNFFFKRIILRPRLTDFEIQSVHSEIDLDQWLGLKAEK